MARCGIVDISCTTATPNSPGRQVQGQSFGLAGHGRKSGRPIAAVLGRPADQLILRRQTILRYVGHGLLAEAFRKEHPGLAPDDVKIATSRVRRVTSHGETPKIGQESRPRLGVMIVSRSGPTGRKTALASILAEPALESLVSCFEQRKPE